MRRWALAVVASLGALPATAGPRLAVDPEAFDFGEVRQQRTVTKEFRLVNIGDADLEILRIATSCGCAVVDAGERVVAPGDSTRLRVQLQTRDDSGPVVRTVVVQTNDPDTPRLTIELRASVVE